MMGRTRRTQPSHGPARPRPCCAASVSADDRQRTWLHRHQRFQPRAGPRAHGLRLRARGIAIKLRRLKDLAASVDGRDSDEDRAPRSTTTRAAVGRGAYRRRRISKERREFDNQGDGWQAMFAARWTRCSAGRPGHRQGPEPAAERQFKITRRSRGSTWPTCCSRCHPALDNAAFMQDIAVARRSVDAGAESCTAGSASFRSKWRWPSFTSAMKWGDRHRARHFRHARRGRSEAWCASRPIACGAPARRLPASTRTRCAAHPAGPEAIVVARRVARPSRWRSLRRRDPQAVVKADVRGWASATRIPRCRAWPDRRFIAACAALPPTDRQRHRHSVHGEIIRALLADVEGPSQHRTGRQRHLDRHDGRRERPGGPTGRRAAEGDWPLQVARVLESQKRARGRARRRDRGHHDRRQRHRVQGAHAITR